jgi:C4-type Zn-finger protein
VQVVDALKGAFGEVLEFFRSLGSDVEEGVGFIVRNMGFLSPIEGALHTIQDVLSPIMWVSAATRSQRKLQHIMSTVLAVRQTSHCAASWR